MPFVMLGVQDENWNMWSMQGTNLNNVKCVLTTCDKRWGSQKYVWEPVFAQCVFVYIVWHLFAKNLVWLLNIVQHENSWSQPLVDGSTKTCLDLIVLCQESPSYVKW